MSFANKRYEIIQKLNRFHNNNLGFEELCRSLFLYQKTYNPVYNAFLQSIGRFDLQVNRHVDYPCLPIELFKTHHVRTGKWNSDLYFESSGTSQSKRSKHYIHELQHYLVNTEKCFEYFYGPATEYCFLALLPGYLDNPRSSLINMLRHFIQVSKYELSGFYLEDYGLLADHISSCIKNKIPTILFGVSFALLDFAGTYPSNLSEIMIIETGGMKGRRAEMPKEELYSHLKTAFKTKTIHSEYGMTELMSQAYAKKAGQFFCPLQQRIFTTELYDPFQIQQPEKVGRINVIDLANFDTCSFIATEDIGRVYEDGSFEVLGRLDNSELRGCNLLLEGI